MSSDVCPGMYDSDGIKSGLTPPRVDLRAIALGPNIASFTDPTPQTKKVPTHPHKGEVVYWLQEWDLNLQPSGYEPD